MIDKIIEVAMSNPVILGAWTHGFLAALALRRGRIEMLLDKVLPVEGGPGDKS